jgi:excisionase family DNA binding protein
MIRATQHLVPLQGIREEDMERATMTVEEAAQVLGIGRITVYEAVHRGELPAIKFGRRYVVPRVVLEMMLRTTPGGSTAAGPAPEC